MPIEGQPIPVAITETLFPLYVPVYPKIPLTLLNCTGSVRKFSAMNFALSGSPGSSTDFAICPFSALL